MSFVWKSNTFIRMSLNAFRDNYPLKYDFLKNYKNPPTYFFTNVLYKYILSRCLQWIFTLFGDSLYNWNFVLSWFTALELAHRIDEIVLFTYHCDTIYRISCMPENWVVICKTAKSSLFFLFLLTNYSLLYNNNE